MITIIIIIIITTTIIIIMIVVVVVVIIINSFTTNIGAVVITIIITNFCLSMTFEGQRLDMVAKAHWSLRCGEDFRRPREDQWNDVRATLGLDLGLEPHHADLDLLADTDKTGGELEVSATARNKGNSPHT